MSEFLRNWLTVLIFGGVGILLVSVFLGLGSLIRPSRETPQKRINYESGVDPQGDMWSQANIRYLDNNYRQTCQLAYLFHVYEK